MWLTAIPLLLLPACWLMFWASCYRPQMVLGRGAALVLVAFALLACVVAVRGPRVPGPARGRSLWRSPCFWALLALGWQLLIYLLAAPVWMPGFPWLGERAAVLASAWGLGCWLAQRDATRSAWGLAGAGAVVLIIGACSLLWPFAHDTGLGVEAPFGLANFNVAAGMPLLGMAGCLWWRERQVRPGIWMHGLLIVGVLALVVVMFRFRQPGDPLQLLRQALAQHSPMLLLHGSVHGGVLEALAMAGVLLISLLPRGAQLATVLVAALGLLVAEGVVMAGGVDTSHFSPSSLQRVYLWRCSVEAIRHAPICGYGVGAAVAVLDQQPSFPEAWMAVPSFPEHAHQELLETVLDGGLVNLILLGLALATTLAPLWRLRDSPVCLALLVAWAGLLSHAMVEVGLSQPGPLLMLALVTGLSWAVANAEASARGAGQEASAGDPLRAWPWRAAQGGLCLVAALGLGVFMWGEMRGHLGTLPVGSVPELQARADSDFKQEIHRGDLRAVQQLVQRLVREVGPLDIMDYQLARFALHNGPSHRQEAIDLAVEQARMLPVFAENLRLLERLRLDCLRRREQWNADAISATLSSARSQAVSCLRQIPDNEKNHSYRSQLMLFLAAPPQPASPPGPAP